MNKRTIFLALWLGFYLGCFYLLINNAVQYEAFIARSIMDEIRNPYTFL